MVPLSHGTGVGLRDGGTCHSRRLEISQVILTELPTPYRKALNLPSHLTGSSGAEVASRGQESHTYALALCTDRVKVRLGMGYAENGVCSSVKLNVVLHDTQHCVLGLVKSSN